MKAVELPFRGGPSTRTVMMPESAQDGEINDQELLEELAANPEHDNKIPEHVLNAVKSYRQKLKVAAEPKVEEIKAEEPKEEKHEHKKFGKKHKKEELE